MKRNLIISVLLALLVLIVQLITGNGWAIGALSAGIALLISMGVLAVSDRYGRRL